MKIEVWAEVTCPWCGLGSHRPDRAVERFEHGDEVEVVHHSFPLSSSFPVGETFSVRDALLRRHGIGGSRAEASTRRIEALATSRSRWRGRISDQRTADATDGLLHVLRTAWDAAHPLTLTTDGDAAVCGPDGCAVPARG